MSRIVLWNSIAKRRRSISDTFYDNGLATLRGFLEDKGHQVKVIDWARDDFFNALTPGFLAKWIRGIYAKMVSIKFKPYKNFLGLCSIHLQDLLSLIQKARLRKKLRELAQEIKQERVRIFGVKIWYGEAFANAKYLARLIKSLSPETLLVAGGYHCTLYEEHILKTSDFDLAVCCEGEYVLEKILEVADSSGEWNKVKMLAKIKELALRNELENIIYRKEGKIIKSKRRQVTVHSTKSIPKYDLDENKVRIHVMVESLGCDWARCNFCVHPYFYPRYSLREPDEIIREMTEMLKAGIGIFRFAGSDTPPAFGAKIANKIKDKNLQVVFGMGSRPIKSAKSHYTELVDSYASLIQAGMKAVFMGGEAGNDFINQEVMNKGVTFEDIVYSIKALREAERKVEQKVYLSLALIYPAPLLGAITLDKLREDNLRLLKETMPDSVMITPPGPFLHTLWYSEKAKFGFELDKDIIKKAMEYEYVLYKPPHLWPKLGISLEGRPFKKLLEECNDFRHAVEKDLGIPTDLSDEHFLMFYAAGIRQKEEILKAKNETMLDIVSCDYTQTRKISREVNTFSKCISSENTL